MGARRMRRLWAKVSGLAVELHRTLRTDLRDLMQRWVGRRAMECLRRIPARVPTAPGTVYAGETTARSGPT